MTNHPPLLSRPLLGTLIGGAVVLGIIIGIRQQPPATTLPQETACEPRSGQDYLARADLIIVGRVFAVVPGPTGADVLITVERTLKGTPPNTGVTIAAKDARPTQETGARRNELHFASGQGDYLLFLRTRRDGRFATSVCDGSRVLAQQPATAPPGTTL
ncbi:MAG: hypothetical protein HY340_03105 [Candidatus Kerfeldbacteria bacterium]|nr:hypothetical protein [Candidatus Kerfeldbacteria bacterium]